MAIANKLFAGMLRPYGYTCKIGMLPGDRTLIADRAKLKIGIILSNSIEKTMQCELCDREIAALTAHHLIPKQNTKRKNEDPGPTIDICSACHRQIHSLFDNKHLERELNTLEKLKNEPQLQNFLAWVKKQKPDKRVQVRGKKN